MAKSRARKLADLIVGAGIDIDGNLTFDGGSVSADLTFGDNDKANFGDASDLQIYHDGSNSYITDSGAGNLRISGTLLQLNDASFNKYFLGSGSIVRLYYADSEKLQTTSSGVSITGQLTASTNLIATTATYSPIVYGGSSSLQLKSNTSEMFAQFTNNGAAELYYDNNKRVETTSTGIDVTGTVVADGLESSGGLSFTAADGIDISGKESVIVRIDSDDNDSGRVFQVLSGPSASQEILIQAAEDAGVSLYYDNTAKIATTATGIDVTGTVTADGLTVDAALATINAPSNNADLILTEGGTNTDARIRNSNGILEIDADLNNEFGNSSIMFAVDGTNRLKIDRTGDIQFYEDGGNNARMSWDASAEALVLGSLNSLRTGSVSGMNNAQLAIESVSYNPASIIDNQDNAGSPGMLVLGTSRGTSNIATAGGVDIVQAGDSVGSLRFAAADGTDLRSNIAEILAVVTPGTTPTENAVSGDLRFQTTNQGQNTTAHMTLTNTGNLGIGTTSPASPIHVETIHEIATIVQSSHNNGTHFVIRNSDATTGRKAIINLAPANNVTGAYVGAEAMEDFSTTSNRTADLFFSTRKDGTLSEKMRIDSNGNVGIGTTSPALQSGGTGIHIDASSYSEIKFTNSTTGTTDSDGTALVSSGNDFQINNRESGNLKLRTSNADALTINSGGNVGIGTTNPLTALHVGTTGGNSYSSTITKSSNMKGGIFTQASNGDDMVGVYFATGSSTEGTHWSGITGSRSNNAAHWGTQLNFYTHDNDVANLNDATQKMIITGDGKVGIGTTSPDVYGVHANQTSQSVYYKAVSGSVASIYGSATALGYAIVGTTSNHALTFYSNSAERMRIDTSGNVGIGVTSIPSWANLMTHGTVAVGGILYMKDTQKIQGLTGFPGGASNLILNPDGGNVGIGTTSPNAKLEVRVAASGTASNIVAAGTDAGIYLEDDETPTNNYFVSKIHNPGNYTAIGGIKFAVSPDAANYSWSGIKAFTSTSGAAGDLRFYTSGGNTSADNSVERMRIDSGGAIRLGGSTTNGAAVISSCTSTSSSGGAGTGNYLELEAMEPNNPNFGAKKLRLGVQGGGYLKMTMPGSAGLFIESPYQANDKIHVGYAGVQLDMNGGGFGGTQNMLIRSKNGIEFHPGGGEKVRFDSSGNVGIGTTDPQHKLHLGSAYDEVIVLDDARTSSNAATTFTSSIIWDTYYDSAARIALEHNDYNVSNRKLKFQVSATTPGTYNDGIVLQQNGYVGIGTASPITKTHISHSTAINDHHGLLYVQNTASATGSSSNAGINVNNYTGTSQFMQWENHGLRIGSRRLFNGGAGDVVFTAGADSEKMRIKSDGKVGINTTAPTETLTVLGATSSKNGHNDLATHTLNSHASVNSSGTLEFTIGYTGTLASGRVLTFTYEATSWKSWIFEIEAASTHRLTTIKSGGYNNSSMSNYVYELGDTANAGTLTVTNSGQHNVFTFTLNSAMTHPLFRVKYSQSGGDGAPRMDRMKLVIT